MAAKRKTIVQSKAKRTTPTKATPKAEPVKPRNVVKVGLLSREENPDAAVARTLTAASVQAARTIQQWEGDNYEVNALAEELITQIREVQGGDLGRAEALLTAQASTLDALFNSLAIRAHRNMGEYLNAAETYLRLGLKAQSQCRATLETLAAIKNPPIVYARQANFASGPQQVNNGLPAHTGKIESLPNELSEASNELLPNTRAPALESRVNQAVETVGAVNRAEDASG